MAQTMKYVIGSGWYCAKGRSFPNGGNVYSRSRQFHELWKHCVFKYSNPAGVLIVDSASPLLPNPDPREQVLRLDANYQNTDYLLSGWGRSFIISAMYAYSCMADLFYVEQDCLAMGNWVGDCYKQSTEYPNRFLAGKPYEDERKVKHHALQMSLVFVPRTIILDLVKAFPNGPLDKGRDESQLGLCGVPLAFHTFGSGRTRPYDLKAPTCEVQHWTDPEILEVADHLGLGDQVHNDYQHREDWE
ncbi:hypothetical protein M0R72_07440 [Candidatus Pacearchaeota archaeon]|nr:hypothetical protein [Candidatus Pacearchaeota archaeon]